MGGQQCPAGQRVPGDESLTEFFALPANAPRLITKCSRCGAAVPPSAHGLHRQHHADVARYLASRDRMLDDLMDLVTKNIQRTSAKITIHGPES